MENNNLSMDDLLRLAKEKIGNFSDSSSDEPSFYSNFNQSAMDYNFIDQHIEPVVQPSLVQSPAPSLQPVVQPSLVQSPAPSLQPIKPLQPSLTPLQPVKPLQPSLTQPVKPLQPINQLTKSNITSRFNFTFLSKSVTIFGFKFTLETLLFIFMAVLVGIMLFKMTGNSVKNDKRKPSHINQPNSNNKKNFPQNR